MKPVVKIYGEKRTGTCWLGVLMSRNLGVRCLENDLGFKHFPPVDPVVYHSQRTIPKATWRAYTEHALRWVVCVKDPYATILSVLDFETTWGEDRYERPELYRNLAERLNLLLASWLGLVDANPGRAAVAKYERFLIDPLKALDDLVATLQFEPRIRSDLVPEEISPGGCPHYRRFASRLKDREYYLQKRYLQRLSRETWAAITETVDWMLMARLGYLSALDPDCDGSRTHGGHMYAIPYAPEQIGLWPGEAHRRIVENRLEAARLTGCPMRLVLIGDVEEPANVPDSVAVVRETPSGACTG